MCVCCVEQMYKQSFKELICKAFKICNVTFPSTKHIHNFPHLNLYVSWRYDLMQEITLSANH